MPFQPPDAAPSASPPTPPIAARRPHAVSSPHGTRLDEYYWLRDDARQNPEVLAHLRAENAYADAVLAPVAALAQRLYAEMTARLVEDDASVPYAWHGDWYYSRYVAGGEYPVYARRRGAIEAPEQVLLDVNQLAAGHDYFDVGDVAVSPGGERVAWAEDAVGRGRYVLKVRDVATGAILPVRVENAEAGIEWTADGESFLYVEKHPTTLLGYRVRRHRLGTDPAADPLVWEQTDPSFYTDLAKSKDEKYLIINTRSTVSSECWYAEAADPALDFRVFLPRERDHEYDIEHRAGRWIVRTNWLARNFRIMEAEATDVGRRDRWREVVAHDPQGFIHGFDLFRDFLAVEERAGGLRRIRVRRWGDPAADLFIQGEGPASGAWLGQNEDIDSQVLRYVTSSLTSPRATYDVDLGTGARELRKRDAVPGGFDPTRYVSEYVWATARDGTAVPVSIARRRDVPADGRAPLLQYAYGAYGLSQDPEFSVALPSLLDRGFVYALAHVRGGQELGRDWYENGRLLRKMNTFTDFVDVTAWLVGRGYGDPRRVFARGGSAGGLTVAAAANLAPSLYRGVVAIVPFVDVVTTMLDETIPLTTNEFDEWGNPREKACYEYMAGYSPYDNLAATAYPAMYVFTGLWDSQVQYFEPAKYVARLRARRTDANPVILRIDMDAGHGGRSGRFDHFHEIAEQFAFLAALAGNP